LELANEVALIRGGASDEQLCEHFAKTPALQGQFATVDAYLVHAHAERRKEPQ
jgi:hypothetical protein